MGNTAALRIPSLAQLLLLDRSLIQLERALSFATLERFQLVGRRLVTLALADHHSVRLLEQQDALLA